MNTCTIFIFPLLVAATILSAQNAEKGDTLIIESDILEISIPSRKVLPQQVPKETEIMRVDTAIQRELREYVLEMKDQKFISDNVVTEVNVDVAGDDLKVVYSYSLINDTLKFQTDDFGLGKYRVDESNALLVTLGIMKKTIEGQLAKYVTPQTRIFLTVKGSADATQIRGVIEYKGEYGNHISEICTFESGIGKVDISKQKGITDNPALAFLRSYAVKDYIENNIDPIKSTYNKWQYAASVVGDKGGKFRRVSIELIVFDALKNN